jgi:sugar phosphate isomerase/epimerase
MKRRTFVQALGAGALAAFALPRRVLAAAKLDRIGLELFSVRKAMQADPDRTLAAVRAIGYTDVELLWSFNNFGRTPAQVKATLAQLGLGAPSAHIDPRTMQTDWQKSLDTAHLLGMQYLIVPSLPESVKTLDDWRQWADRMNTAGAAARKANLWVAFHNEAEHMIPIDGQIPYDVFIARLDPSVVRLQLDVGNMLIGGGDPMQYLAKHRDRYWSFHLKDVVASKKQDTELGTGIVNFKQLLSSIPNLASKPAYVEQEGPADELAAMKVDFNYLNTLQF